METPIQRHDVILTRGSERQVHAVRYPPHVHQRDSTSSTRSRARAVPFDRETGSGVVVAGLVPARMVSERVVTHAIQIPSSKSQPLTSPTPKPTPDSKLPPTPRQFEGRWIWGLEWLELGAWIWDLQKTPSSVPPPTAFGSRSPVDRIAPGPRVTADDFRCSKTAVRVRSGVTRSTAAPPPARTRRRVRDAPRDVVDNDRTDGPADRIDSTVIAYTKSNRAKQSRWRRRRLGRRRGDRALTKPSGRPVRRRGSRRITRGCAPPQPTFPSAPDPPGPEHADHDRRD